MGIPDYTSGYLSYWMVSWGHWNMLSILLHILYKLLVRKKHFVRRWIPFTVCSMSMITESYESFENVLADSKMSHKYMEYINLNLSILVSL